MYFPSTLQVPKLRVAKSLDGASMVKHEETMIWMTCVVLLLLEFQRIEAFDVFAPLYWSGPYYIDPPLQLINATIFTCGGSSTTCCGAPPDPQGASPAVLFVINSRLYCPYLYPEVIANLAYQIGFDAVGTTDTFQPLGAQALIEWKENSAPIPIFEISPAEFRTALKNNHSTSLFESKPNIYSQSPAVQKIILFEGIIGILNMLVGFGSLWRRFKLKRESQPNTSIMGELKRPVNLVYMLDLFLCTARCKSSNVFTI
jgi:hypothetical protein